MSEKPLTIEDCEHLFWLAAREVVFFSTYNEGAEDWDAGWHPAVNCSDTFYYASADACSFDPHEAKEIRSAFEQWGWAGAVAWCALKRNEEPLPHLRTDQYLEALSALRGGEAVSVALKPCPFCGGTPYFEGDASVWRDGNQYVELSLTCCATMTESIGWQRARDMSVGERTAELRDKLMTSWNTRYTQGLKEAGRDAEEIRELRAELETERMRLVACGVVAMSNTPESAAKARNMLPEYRSASCDDVARMVDEQMRLRAELAASREREARMRAKLEYALRQNDLDMLLTGDEIRDCRAALAEGAQE